MAVAKETVQSHGNGAVLLNQNAIELLSDKLMNIVNKYKNNWHLMTYPWKIRPVADKWIYGSLPQGSCQVSTYPHFCLEAEESTLHDDHVDKYHKPSREVTLDIWKEDGKQELISAQKHWDSITF